MVIVINSRRNVSQRAAGFGVTPLATVQGYISTELGKLQNQNYINYDDGYVCDIYLNLN